jgi:glutamine amidotransferase
MVAIIDYGMGNLKSVYNALDILGCEPKIVSDPDKLKSFDHVILPGVGSFRLCMENLRKDGFDESLMTFIKSGKPLMGICLGMQILASHGFEDGESKGLNIIPGEVIKFDDSNTQISIPHVGWNDVEFNLNGKALTKKINTNDTFYFTHSYYFKPNDESFTFSKTFYGSYFTSSVLKENVFATQFHPEKSQDVGLKLFKNFINWIP